MCLECCGKRQVASASSRKVGSPGPGRGAGSVSLQSVGGPPRALSVGARKRQKLSATKHDLLSPRPMLELPVTSDLPSLGQMFVGIGTGYAFLRQVTFLCNAILVGASVALIASGFHTANSRLIALFGKMYAYGMVSFGFSLLLSSMLGCTGSCFESKCTLKVFSASNALLVICELFAMYVLFTTNFKSLFEKAWKNDESQVMEEWKCDDREMCEDKADRKAERYEVVMASMAVCILLYQSLMILAAFVYLRGLNKKQYNIRQIAGIKSPNASLTNSTGSVFSFFGRSLTNADALKKMKLRPLSETLDSKALRKLRSDDSY